MQSDLALALDPTGVLVNEHMAWHHLFARQYPTAIIQAQKTIEIDPGFAPAHRILGLAYLYSNMREKGCSEFETDVRLTHEDPTSTAYLARCYAITGHQQLARKMVVTLVGAAQERYISAAEIGAIYAALGEQAAALLWLRRGLDEIAGAMLYLNVDPVWDGLRTVPQFQQIVRQVHLVPSPVPLHDDIDRMPSN